MGRRKRKRRPGTPGPPGAPPGKGDREKNRRSELCPALRNIVSRRIHMPSRLV